MEVIWEIVLFFLQNIIIISWYVRGLRGRGENQLNSIQSGRRRLLLLINFIVVVRSYPRAMKIPWNVMNERIV